MANPTISPDGTRVAADVSDTKANNVDVCIESPTTNTRFTFDPAEEVVGVWSRDGSKIAYRSNIITGTALFVKAASGLEKEKLIFSAGLTDDMFASSWSPDDSQIVCTY